MKVDPCKTRDFVNVSVWSHLFMIVIAANPFMLNPYSVPCPGYQLSNQKNLKSLNGQYTEMDNTCTSSIDHTTINFDNEVKK